jgi:hypothetical protein
VLGLTAMEYLFGFVCTLIKIALQASVYASVLHWLARLADARLVNYPLVRASRDKRRFWRRSFAIAYGGLFLFSCTYWGDHGLGDHARLPIGHGEAIEELNGIETYFEAETPLKVATDQPFIDRFQVAGDVLCGQASDKSYFAYNLITKEQQSFADSLAYSTYATPRGLAPISEFQSFWKQYSRYWGGWRFWLLA